MRLIDANELEKVMTEDWFLHILVTTKSKDAMREALRDCIDSVPLAYDVEKVLEQIKYKLFCRDLPTNIVDHIVRKGGVE